MENKTVGIRPDQETRLKELEEKLLDVFIDEADPGVWINEEKAEEKAREVEAFDAKAAAKIRSGWKGDRYWEKKNANQTIALITRIVCYRKALAEVPGSRPLAGDTEEAMKKDMADAETKVQERLRVARSKIKLVKR